jgi:hypothetical protein
MRYNLKALLIAGAFCPPVIAACLYIALNGGWCIIFAILVAMVGFWVLSRPT